MVSEDPTQRYALEQFLERVSTTTGEVLEEPVRPEELLVRSHRDLHPLDVHASFMASRTVRATQSVEKTLQRWRKMRRLAWRISGGIAWVVRGDRVRVARRLFGLEHVTSFFRFRRLPFEDGEREHHISALRAEAVKGLEQARSRAGLCVLVTGGTGFLGQELIAQAAGNEEIAELILLIRPQEIRNRKTGELLETLSPTERGEKLLRRLGVTPGPGVPQFRFLAGDIEEAQLGLDPAEVEALAQRVTHVVHCAASVAFDAPYEESFRANVEGARRVLELSAALHGAEGSPFVAHLSVETSYIHGRQRLALAREAEMVFPRGYYNNYYELTKAMSSLEAERFLFERGLPVVHVCPSIVIGSQGTGNNRGDTKVVNAPVNLFGRAHEALEESTEDWIARSKAALLARLACVFPGDPSAEINMIPVDWVAAGLLAALTRPEAVGKRIHLANDRRLKAEQIAQILEEELGVRVQLAEPTLHRNFGLPLAGRLLAWFQLGRLAQIMTQMNDVFGGYSEWGQPIHEVGNDVRLLGLPPERPDPEQSFRMLCRHNHWVQDFGRLRDPDELARREAAWSRFLGELEERSGAPAGVLDAESFRTEVIQGWEFKPSEH